MHHTWQFAFRPSLNVKQTKTLGSTRGTLADDIIALRLNNIPIMPELFQCVSHNPVLV